MAIVEPRISAPTEGREAAKLLRNVRSLADMTSELAAAHDFGTTARLTLLTMLGALSATRGGIWLYDPAAGALNAAVTRGLATEVGALPLPEEAAEALKDAAPTVFLPGDELGVPTITALYQRCPELAAVVPMVARGELIGLLAIGSKLNRQPYSGPELEVLGTLGTMAASGVYSHNLITGLQRANRQLLETQEQLIRSEQLATLGSTAAGIAHEIGNPLTSIMGYAITIREMAEEMTPDLLEELIEPILDESERLKEILAELKDYAKPKGYDTEPISLCELVDDTLRFTRYDRLFRNRIDVRRVYESAPVVSVNRSKIKQVLLNLLRNAAQAMQGQDRAPYLEVRVASDDESARLSVTDNGSGIPADRLDKIWQPFFTTKGEGGTGLGLDLCRQICERHHGGISVTSQVGVGTTFTVRLPVHLQSEEPASEVESAAA